VIKDPETYERIEKVVLLHGCRRVDLGCEVIDAVCKMKWRFQAASSRYDR